MPDTDTINEFRGDVAMQLRDLGYPALADYVGALSDERIADLYESAVNGTADAIIDRG